MKTREMRNNEFIDVTLVSGDNQKLMAHKVVLAVSSTFFENVLSNEKHPYPMILMRGVQHKILEALLDFIYSGKTRLDKNHIDLFMKFITEIGLYGLVDE